MSSADAPPAKPISSGHATEPRRRSDVDTAGKSIPSHVRPTFRQVVQLATRHARVLLQIRIRHERLVAAGLGVLVALVEGFLRGRCRGFCPDSAVLMVDDELEYMFDNLVRGVLPPGALV